MNYYKPYKYTSVDINKRWIILLVVLCAMLLLWFFPTQALTSEAIADINKNYNNPTEVIETYKELIPSVYNLTFGGVKKLKTMYFDIVIDFKEQGLTNSTLQWIFFFHLVSIGLCAWCVFNSHKILKLLVIILTSVCAVGFFLTITNNASDLLSAFNSVLGGIYTINNFLTLGFGGWAPILLYIATVFLGVYFYSED